VPLIYWRQQVKWRQAGTDEMQRERRRGDEWFLRRRLWQARIDGAVGSPVKIVSASKTADVGGREVVLC
jgi:hypothetical protein